MHDNRPFIWIIDSDRKPLADFTDAFFWADAAYFGPDEPAPDWNDAPDAVFFSAEIAGGVEGEAFAELLRAADGVALLAVAKTRSLAQAVAFFRAGVADYLSLPLYEDDARERFLAAMERSERLAPPTVTVEFESVDGDEGEVSLSLAPLGAEAAGEDILAGLAAFPPSESPPAVRPEGIGAEEPEPVDGLPIPSLWEELPCGLLVFDSGGGLVFSNALALELFGQPDFDALRNALGAGRSALAAHASGGRPLADNQWPQALAVKTRAARSAIVSVEKPDRRRVWLRIDCLPHLSDGRISRLTMTVVNLTGDLPPLARAEAKPAAAKREKARTRAKRGK